MVSNFGNFFALSILYLIAHDLPLTALQLLLTSLATDVPMIAIATDAVDHSELEKPSKYNVRALIRLSTALGVLTALFIFGFYFLIRIYPAGWSQTMIFLFLTLIGLVVIFSVRTEKTFWRATKLSPFLSLALLATAIISILFIYLPLTKNLFSFTSLPISAISLIIFSTLVYLFALDFLKLIIYRKQSIRNKIIATSLQ